jgi:hypothetical protein
MTNSQECPEPETSTIAGKPDSQPSKPPTPIKVPPMGVKPEDHLKMFQFVREEIRFQNQQLNNRIGAYVTSQSFLVTAMIAGQRGESKPIGLQLVTLGAIPLVGILLSVFLLVAILGALNRIKEQRKIMNGPPYKELCGVLIAEDPKEQDHNRGKRFAIVMPWVFIVFWISAGIMLSIWQ